MAEANSLPAPLRSRASDEPRSARPSRNAASTSIRQVGPPPFGTEPTLRSRVTAEDDASIPADAAVVSLRTTSGETLSAHIAHARGSLARPLSDGELEAKLRELANYGAPRVDAGRLIAGLWNIDQRESIGDLMAMTISGAE